MKPKYVTSAPRVVEVLGIKQHIGIFRCPFHDLFCIWTERKDRYALFPRELDARSYERFSDAFAFQRRIYSRVLNDKLIGARPYIDHLSEVFTAF